MDNSLIFELNLRRLEGFATPPPTSQNPIWPQQHHNLGNLTLFSAYLGHFLSFLEFSDFSEHFEKISLFWCSDKEVGLPEVQHVTALASPMRCDAQASANWEPLPAEAQTQKQRSLQSM
jgi:hypothetical protein